MSTSHEVFVKECKVGSCTICGANQDQSAIMKQNSGPWFFFYSFIYIIIYREDMYIHTYTHIQSPVSKAQCSYA